MPASFTGKSASLAGMGVSVYDKPRHWNNHFGSESMPHRILCVAIASLCFVAMSGIFANTVKGVGDEPDVAIQQFIVKRIAHAGGGLQNLTYTNSYQALESNLKKGFEYFEIDFVFTSDGHLVCLHDWNKNFERTFGSSTDQPLTLEAFEELTGRNERFTNCTLSGLGAWMREHPSAIIVTDVKEDNVKALRLIADMLPDSARRVIPQIYHPKNFQAVKAMGFEQIIWTLYRIRIGNAEVLKRSADWPRPFAITMPKKRAQSVLPTMLSERGIPTYVHTINSAEEMNRFLKELGVKEIYTDFLAP